MIVLAEAPAAPPKVFIPWRGARNTYADGASSTAFRLTKLHGAAPRSQGHPHSDR